MFSNLPCDFHVYIVGDSDCYETACKFFGNRVAFVKDEEPPKVVPYFVMSEWHSEKNDRFFDEGSTNNSHLFQKMAIANDMIKRSGVSYKCIVKLRVDCILQGEYQSYIRKVISEPEVQCIGNHDWHFIGKPDIMKYYLNIGQVDVTFFQFKKEDHSFKNTSILSKETFFDWLKDEKIHKNAAELLLSVYILEYCKNNGIDPNKSLFMANRKLVRVATEPWTYMPIGDELI